MEMSNTQFIPASQQSTWEALNDPAVLRACVPGCESIEKISDTEYRLAMVAKIGPVSAKFKGRLLLSDVQAPDAYKVTFEGQGGAAGFAKGAADVHLSPEGEGTQLSYTVEAQVGGKIAQIGSRLVNGAAKKMADQFFQAFAAHVGGEGAADEAETAPEAQPDNDPNAATRKHWWQRGR